MGLFKGLKKALKVVAPIAYATRNLPRDIGRGLKNAGNDPLKAITAAGLAVFGGPIGMAAAAGIMAQSGKEAHAGQVALKQEKQAKIGEAIKEAEYNQQVAAANERAYQQNRASLLSARREYGKKIGTAYVRAGARTSDETESKLG